MKSLSVSDRGILTFQGKVGSLAASPVALGAVSSSTTSLCRADAGDSFDRWRHPELAGRDDLVFDVVRFLSRGDFVEFAEQRDRIILPGAPGKVVSRPAASARPHWRCAAIGGGGASTRLCQDLRVLLELFDCRRVALLAAGYHSTQPGWPSGRRIFVGERCAAAPDKDCGRKGDSDYARCHLCSNATARRRFAFLRRARSIVRSGTNRATARAGDRRSRLARLTTIITTHSKHRIPDGNHYPSGSQIGSSKCLFAGERRARRRLSKHASVAAAGRQGGSAQASE